MKAGVVIVHFRIFRVAINILFIDIKVEILIREERKLAIDVEV